MLEKAHLRSAMPKSAHPTDLETLTTERTFTCVWQLRFCYLWPFGLPDLTTRKRRCPERICMRPIYTKIIFYVFAINYKYLITYCFLNHISLMIWLYLTVSCFASQTPCNYSIGSISISIVTWLLQLSYLIYFVLWSIKHSLMGKTTQH